ncbi:MAG: hypothetical protein GX231_05640 [Tissierellia bacterium]|nr:hypothetical protein [Tissierellia bacterium]
MVESNNKHRGFKVFLLIIGLLALVLMNNNARKTLIFQVDRLFNKGSDLKLDTQYNGSNLNYYNDTLIRWKDSKITYLNKDGSENWTKEFDFMNPDIYFGKEIIYIMDKSTGDIYLMDNKGETKSRIQIEKNIFNLRESNNYFFVHSKEDKVESLSIFSKDGNSVEKLDISDYILTYAINQKGNIYMYSTIIVSEEGLTSLIHVKNLESDENYNIELSDEVVIFSEFINDRLILLTDTNLYLTEEGNVTLSYPHNGNQDILVKDEEVYLLNNNVLDIVGLNGQSLNRIDLTIDGNRIIDLEDCIGVFGQKDLVILQNQKEILKYNGEDEILRVTGNKKKIAIHYVDKINIFRL